MGRRNLPIYECMNYKRTLSIDYAFDGRKDGLYVFINETGNRELFARRGSPPAGWYLQRGAFFFEFVRSDKESE